MEDDLAPYMEKAAAKFADARARFPVWFDCPEVLAPVLCGRTEGHRDWTWDMYIESYAWLLKTNAQPRIPA